MNYLGELAALGTSLAFSLGSTFFSLAGRRLGATVVNRARLLLSAIFLILLHWALLGSLLPHAADPQRWLWLGLSGIVGLVLGDIFLFHAFVWIGPRLSMLMMSLAPVIATLQAWIFLNEKLGGVQLVGIVLTLLGVAWVVLERSGTGARDHNYARGILYGLGGAIGQATGLVLAKNGLGGEFSAISGNVIRMLVATVVMWTITLLQRQAGPTLQALRHNRRGVGYMLGGALFGPIVGVSLSLLAVQRAEVGIASTLMALPPVFLLPISAVVFKERYGWGVVAGTFIAIAGVAILFLV